MTETVLVTDGEQRSALAIVRSLGMAGYRIMVISAHPLPLAAASRYCTKLIRAPDPVRNPEHFATMVAECCKSEAAVWLIPVTEASLRALLPARDHLSARIPFPDTTVFSAVSDKARLLTEAMRLGIDVPKQVTLEHPGIIVDVEALGFPLVIKPSRSVHFGQRFAVEYASDMTELRRQLSALPAAGYPVLLQERLVGPGIGIFLLPWDGALRGVFAHRRIREKPPSGGVSVVAESVPANPLLVTQSAQLLESFGWEGVAMVEYKRDVRSGRTVLMEVNGRFWGSLQLAVDAGVNFPMILLDCAGGGPPAAPPQYQPGMRSRWWWGDVDHLLMRIRSSVRTLNLPPDTPGRASALLAFLRERGRNEIVRFHDLGPAVSETINWLLRR